METIAFHLAPSVATGIIQRATSLVVALMSPSPRHPPGMKQVQEELTMLDLEAKLKCWKSLVTALAPRTLPLPVMIALHWFAESIHHVEESLQLLKNAIEYHQSKYLAPWRACDFGEALKILSEKVKILGERETTLLQMIAIDFAKLDPEDSPTLP